MRKGFSIFKHALLGIAAVLMLTSSAWAATYYVDPSGSDSNPGSQTSPFKTVAHAASAARSGDVVHVDAGTYTETSQISLAPGATLEGAGSTSVIVAGFAANPLIALVSGSEGTVGGQEVRYLKLDGNSLTGLTAIYIARRSSVAVHDCAFVNFGQTGVTVNGGNEYPDNSEPTTYATGVSVYNNTFTNCSVLMGAGWISGSIYIRGLQGARIYKNTMTENQRGSNSGGCVVFYNNGWFKDLGIYGNNMTTIENVDSSHFAIELWNSHQVEIYNNIITGNINFDTVSPGSYAYGVNVHDNLIGYPSQSTYANKAVCFDGNCSGVIISDNYIKNIHLGVYFYFRTGGITVSNVQIYYNIFDGVGMVGDTGKAFVCDAADNTGVFTNLKIMNNVVYARYSNMDVGIGFKSYGAWSNFYAQNNIIEGSIGPAIETWSGASGATLSYVYIQDNDFYANATNAFVNNLPAANATNQGNITGNPLFVSAGSNFQLQSGSPCIDAGVNTGLTADYAGDPAPVGSGYDIGAYEYGSAAISPPSNLQIF